MDINTGQQLQKLPATKRRKAKRRRQKGDGSIVERHNAFHLRYWSVDEQGSRVQRSTMSIASL
jgi:hypothetical protein